MTVQPKQTKMLYSCNA